MRNVVKIFWCLAISYRLSLHLKPLLLLLFILIATINLFSQDNNQISPKLNFDRIGFIENNGQVEDQFHNTNSTVKYMLRLKGMNVQLKNNSFSYDTYDVLNGKPNEVEKSLLNDNKIKKDSTFYKFHRVDIQFPGANVTPKITAEGKSSTYTTYYTAHAKGGSKAYRYSRIIYQELYPGIDLVFETENNQTGKEFEYYFIVKPGADAGKIRLQYNGADTRLENNIITISFENRKMKETIPASYLALKNDSSLSSYSEKVLVRVNYKKFDSKTYGFNVPFYDKSKTLIIDPTPEIVWGTYYGGYLSDYANSIAMRPDGTIVVAGGSSNDNLATAGAYQVSLVGYLDAMVGEFTSSGNLLWMTYFGGEDQDISFGICTDLNGNIFTVGITDSKTGIATPGSYQPMAGDLTYGRDGFIAKFDGSGNRIWSTYYGGDDVDFLHAVKADAEGNIFVAGWTLSTSNIASAGAFQTSYASNHNNPLDESDAFIARFGNNGNRIWATYFGSTGFDRFYAMALEDSGNVYASGISNSPGNIATAGVFQPNLSGTKDDALLVKFNKNGDRIWATYYGGGEDDYSQALACDHQGNIIMGGVTESLSGMATSGTHQPLFGGMTRDDFLVKMGPTGDRLWGTYYGGNGVDFIYAVTCDVNDNIIIGGSTFSSNNIATANAYNTIGPGSTGNLCAFFAKLTATGMRKWGTYYGSGQYNLGEVQGVVTDISGNIFVCGETVASSNIATCGAFQENWSGNSDIFVGMFSETIISNTVSVSIISDKDTAICAGTLVTFNATAINAGTSPVYQWQVNGLNAGTNAAIFTTSNLNNGDKVSCMVTSNSTCIVNPQAISDTITISVIAPVTPSVSISSSITGAICSATPVTFTAAPVNGGAHPVCQWQINGVNAGSNSEIFTTNNLSNGDIVNCILTNNASCNVTPSAVSNDIMINVDPTIFPSISINASSFEVCEGTLVTFSAASFNTGNNPGYQWQVNGVNVASGSNYTTSSLGSNDIVQCLITPANSVCSNALNIASNYISIVVDPRPAFTIQPDNPKISFGDTLQLSVSDTSNVNVYKWSTPDFLSNVTISNPKAWPDNTQAYTLEGTSVKGCKTTKQVIVKVIKGIFIPNAFTPNNDGVNDQWGINGLELYPDCIVQVFNRFGEQLYKSIGYASPWNGIYKSKLLTTGIYVYVINFKNGSKPLKGSVSIIR